MKTKLYHKKSLKNLVLIVPIKNEKINVTLMTYNINILYSDVEIIFVYDTKSENSLSDLKKLKKKFKINFIYSKNKGISGSINTALKSCVENKLIGIALADDLGVIYQLDIIYKEMFKLKNKKTVLTTTRYSKGGKRLHGSKPEYLLSFLANLFFRLIYKTSDATTACRFAWKKDFYLLSKNINERSWAYNLVFITLAKKKNFKIIEVPIISIDRLKFGNSTFKLFSWIIKYLKVFFKSIKILYLKN